MTREGFLKRLRDGKVVNCIYHRDGLTGLLSAWAYQGRFILTWEECPFGEQHNEHLYTLDQRHEFTSAEAVLAFAEEAGYPASAFGP